MIAQKGEMQMSGVEMTSIAEAVPPPDKTGIAVAPSWSWADIEGLLSAEWEIGGSATPALVSRALVAGK
jgi:hypothetical protein